MSPSPTTRPSQAGKDPNPMHDEKPGQQPAEPEDAGAFVKLFGAAQIVFIVCFFMFVDYNNDNAAGDIGTVTASYSYYTDVALMIFVGFGFLMTFLARYAHSALGYTFMLTCVTIQLSVLCQGFFGHLHAGDLFEDRSIAESCAASADCTFTAGDSSTCDSAGGCAYTASIAAVAEAADTCAAPACAFTAGDSSTCGTGCAYTAPVAEVTEVTETCAASVDCTFTAGDASTCDSAGGCAYTAPVAAVAEVTEACAAPACAYTAGDSSTCGTGCAYTAPVAAVAEVTEACAASVDCTFTAGDSSTCDSAGGCAYTAAVAAVAEAADTCAAPACAFTAGDSSTCGTGCEYTAAADAPAAILIDVRTLINSLFAAGCVMISFGALVGRASPTQLLLMTVVEVGLFHLNEWIGAGELSAIDMGGSMFVHTFGAYFGLAASLMLSRGTAETQQDKQLNTSSHTSDITAMLGTIVLWVLWPSFNGALAPTADSQMRVVINTVLSLTTSCTLAFIMSHWVGKGRFNMVHIQNATLAGGVAIGSSSDLVVGPGGAVLVGSIAGTLSVTGYHYLQPWLQDKLGLHDVCGVHNLHGLPGLLGGLTGAISAAMASEQVYGTSFEVLFSEGRTPETQWPYQIWALLLTLTFSIVGGALCGTMMRMLPGVGKRYRDDSHWTVEAGLPAP